MTWEFNILDSLQTIHSDGLSAVMKFFTRLGDHAIFPIVLALLLLIIPMTRKIGLCVTIALILDFIICNGILKNLVARIRPYDVNTTVQLIIEAQKDYSFPSGHTGAMFAAAWALFFSAGKKWWIPMMILSAIVAFSRLYLYVHYPTDILGGFIIGLVTGWAGAKIGTTLWKKIESRKIESRR